MSLLGKFVGPIGRIRYTWNYYSPEGDASLYSEIKQNAKDLGFKLVSVYECQFEENNSTFTIEALNDEMDAVFTLTWSQYIDFEAYAHSRDTTFPADWVTILLYWTTRQADRRLGLFLFSVLVTIMGPLALEAIYHKHGFIFISVMGYAALLALSLLRIYDDSRVAKFEREIRLRDF